MVGVLRSNKVDVPESLEDLLSVIVKWSIDWRAKRRAGQEEKMKQEMSAVGRVALWGQRWKQYQFRKASSLVFLTMQKPSKCDNNFKLQVD